MVYVYTALFARLHSFSFARGFAHFCVVCLVCIYLNGFARTHVFFCAHALPGTRRAHRLRFIFLTLSRRFIFVVIVLIEQFA